MDCLPGEDWHTGTSTRWSGRTPQCLLHNLGWIAHLIPNLHRIPSRHPNLNLRRNRNHHLIRTHPQTQIRLSPILRSSQMRYSLKFPHSRLKT